MHELSELGVADIATAEARPPWQRRDSVSLALVVALGAALPLVLAAVSHSLTIPHEDDWAYRRIAAGLFHTHHFRFIGWGVMTLVGQALSVQPLLELAHGGTWAYGTYGAIAAGVALTASYCLARRFLPTSRALLVAGLVAVAPGFVVLGPTFMTDVPAFAATMACLAIGVAAFDRVGRRHWVWLSASMAVGVFGFSIRQVCIAAPAAVLVAALARAPRDWRRTVALGAVAGAACVAVSLWSSGLPGPHEANLLPYTLRSGFISTFRLGGDLGLAIAPLAIWVLVRPEERVARRMAGGLGVVALALVLAGRGPKTLLQGNILTRDGIGGTGAVGPNLFPAAIWSVIGVVAVAGMIGVASIAMSRLISARHTGTASRVLAWFARPEALLAIFLLIGGGGLVGLTLDGLQAFDRYTWSLIAPLAILLLIGQAAPNGRARLDFSGLAACSLTAALALVALALLVNANAFDTARWRAGSTLVRAGIPARNIDAGFEWFGTHQPGPVTDAYASARHGTFTWYESIFAEGPICALVSSTPSADSGLSPAGSTTYRLLGPIGSTVHLWRYRQKGVTGCTG